LIFQVTAKEPGADQVLCLATCRISELIEFAKNA
jgi:hypothetical protein